MIETDDNLPKPDDSDLGIDEPTQPDGDDSTLADKYSGNDS